MHVNRFSAMLGIAYLLRSTTTTGPPFCFTPVSQLFLGFYYKLEDINGTNSLIGFLTIPLYDWTNKSCDNFKQPMKNRVKM